MKQQTQQIILFEQKKETVTKIKCKGFAAEKNVSVQTKFVVKSLPNNKKTKKTGWTSTQSGQRADYFANSNSYGPFYTPLCGWVC